jgi:glycosyltransferase involved in cell wall biosynthesis
LVKYLMVGEGNYIDGLLDEGIKKTGFVAMRDFEILLSCSDIVVNLRNPSMGETSATLLRAMMAGKPCVVTDIAWFSELPDDVVIKIPKNRYHEKENLKIELELLINSPTKRKRIGENAKNYVQRHHDPSKIADEMKQFMDKCFSSRNMPISELCLRSNAKRLDDIELGNREDLLSKNYAIRNHDRLKQIGLDISSKSLKR